MENDQKICSLSTHHALVFEVLGVPTEWGQSVKVVGSWPELGNWNVNHAFSLKYGENSWRGVLELSTRVDRLEYKFVIVKGDDIVCWESLQGQHHLQNRDLSLTTLQPQLMIICDRWCQSPHLSLLFKFRPPPTASESRRAVVILGRKLEIDGSASLLLQDRVTKGVEFFLQLEEQHPQSNWLILSGGVVRSPALAEAQVMSEMALKMGIANNDRMLLDTCSRNTIENALNVYFLCVLHHIHTVHLITSDFHMERALRIFRVIMPPLLGYDIHPISLESQSFLSLAEQHHEHVVEKKMISLLSRHLAEYGVSRV